MSSLTRRVFSNLKTSVTLFKADVALGSIILYPIRRRLRRHARNQIDLKNGMSFVSAPTEPLLSIFEEVWLDECYDFHNSYISERDVIFDIGANVGVFALWAATRHPKARIVCVEPTPESCNFLRRNLAGNGLSRIVIVQSACGAGREAVLYKRGVQAMNTLYPQDNYSSRFHPLTRTQVISLDELFSTFDLETRAWVKLDCEGAEYEILLNARDDTLRRISGISMEYHMGLNEHTPEELETFLKAHGFQVERLPPIDAESGYLHARRFD